MAIPLERGQELQGVLPNGRCGAVVRLIAQLIAVWGGSSCPITHQPAVSGFCFFCPYFCHTEMAVSLEGVPNFGNGDIPFVCLLHVSSLPPKQVPYVFGSHGWWWVDPVQTLKSYWPWLNMPHPNYMTHKLLIYPNVVVHDLSLIEKWLAATSHHSPALPCSILSWPALPRVDNQGNLGLFGVPLRTSAAIFGHH